VWKYGFDVVDVNTAVNSAGAILRGEGAPPSQKSGPSVPPTGMLYIISRNVSPKKPRNYSTCSLLHTF